MRGIAIWLGDEVAMADQAQGLRALANKARRDHSRVLFPSDDADNDSLTDSLTDSFNKSLSESFAQNNNTAVSFNASSSETTRVSLIESGDYSHGSVSECPDPMDILNPTSAVVKTRSIQRLARVVAITSGKGGVGKTNFCSNLALTLAARGQRVIVVDADLGLANVHVVMGVAPRYHLEHVMNGEKTLSEVLYTGPGGVGIIGGGSGLTDLANLDQERRQRFIQSLSELDSISDVVLLDTGAGLSHNVLSFLCAVNEVIVITTPEPTAITDAYATIKVLSRENPLAQQRLVVNMAQSQAEAQAVAQRLQGIAQRFLQHDLSWLGYLPYDMTVSRAVRAQQPFTTLHPTAPVSRAMLEIAARLGYEQATTTAQSDGVSGLLTRMQRFFGLRSTTV